MVLFTLRYLECKRKVVEQKNAELMFPNFSSHYNYIHTFITHVIQVLGLSQSLVLKFETFYIILFLDINQAPNNLQKGI